MKPELRDLLESILKTTKNILLSGDNIYPVAFLIKGNKLINSIVFDLGETHRERQAIWMTIAAKAALEKCDGVVLLADVYVSKLTPEEADTHPELLKRAPSQDPNRIQAALITYIASDKHDHTIMIPYDQNNMGTHIKEEGIVWTEDVELEGIQGELFHAAFQMPEEKLRLVSEMLSTVVHRKAIDTETGGEVEPGDGKGWLPEQDD